MGQPNRVRPGSSKWLTGERWRLKDPAQLKVHLRFIMGARWIGLEIEQIALMLKMEAEKCLETWGVLENCKNMVVRESLRFGLPKDAAVILPHKDTLDRLFQSPIIRCPKCRSSLTHVPCITCARDGEWYEPNTDNTPLTEPKTMTKFEPGSREKVEVMRGRVERGESPFHDNDARLGVSYTKPVGITVIRMAETDFGAGHWDDFGYENSD